MPPEAAPVLEFDPGRKPVSFRLVVALQCLNLSLFDAPENNVFRGRSARPHPLSGILQWCPHFLHATFIHTAEGGLGSSSVAGGVIEPDVRMAKRP